MFRLTLLILQITVIFFQTACTGYGLIYDDLRQPSSDSEQYCLEQVNSDCLLSSAVDIAMAMSDDLAQAEAFKILAKTYYEMGNQTAAFKSIGAMRITAMQFASLVELSAIASNRGTNTQPLTNLAASITAQLQQPTDKLAAVILSAILYLETQQAIKAQPLLQQAINLATTAQAKGDTIIEAQFFNRILPTLLQYECFDLISTLAKQPKEPTLQISAWVEYSLQLKNSRPQQAKQQQQQIVNYWHRLNRQQRKLTQPIIVKLLVNFNKLAVARMIRNQQTEVMDSAILTAMIIQQLTTAAKIKPAKVELVRLLHDVRIHSQLEGLILKQQTKLNNKTLLNTFYTDKFKLDNLRALAIANLALALSNTGKMSEAIHFTEQIQRTMGHIQGTILTKIALNYAQQGAIDSALQTTESMHRPINRAASLAQISAILATNDNVARAISIANRVNRQSWRDIAFSEISITQARLNDLNSSITTLKTIKRSYSAVYAMTGVARTLQARQNKR